MRAVLIAVVFAAGALAACKTDMDCSLAGTCVDGTCQCEAWVKGPDCAALNLQPLNSTADIKSVVEPVGNYTTWGGSPVFDGKVYHVFSAEMANQCSLGVWTFKSQVIHSTSTSPTGPFTKQDVAVGPEAHNPVLSRATDGTWLLWTCGCPHAPPAGDDGCSRDFTTCPSGSAASWTTTVYSSASLDGPWTPHVDILNGIGGPGAPGNLSQNVSPLHEPDGSVLLMFKGPDNNTEASIAYAPHWTGPYTLIHKNVFASVLAENITNEDCWWWKSTKTGYYHVLSHRMLTSNRESDVCGGHAFAANISDWHYALTPAYTTEVGLADGSTASLERRERPQVMFDADGQPAVLFNGVVAGSGVQPFTFAQKLGGEQ